MSDQAKIQRLLRLILLLSGNKIYSIKEISDRMGLDKRSIYRYLNTLEIAGLVLIRKNGYKLFQNNPHTKAINKLFHFSGEEAYLLYQLLTEARGGNSTREKLMRKLHSLYDFKILASLVGKNELDHINNLKTAIENRKQVMLKGYRSSNSKTIQDRKVEAFEFLPEYEGVWCFDLTDKTNKQFLISRIQEIEVLDRSWYYEHLHKIPFTDAFGMSADSPICSVKLRLTLKAYNLLLEEHPQAQKHLIYEGKDYLLNIPVANFPGIGRFVLGLPGEVEVIENEDFIKFLKNQQKKIFV